MEQVSDIVNFDSYFQRIGYQGELRSAEGREQAPTLKTLQEIHLCHTKAIAFENLSPLLKQPVDLDLASLQQKLIQEGRGGYCFEQNLLFRAVLTGLGFQVTNLAARVLWQVPAGRMTPRSHMLLKVDLNGESYIADVGFGGLTLTTPLSLTPGIEQHTAHEPFRLVEAERTYLMQVFIDQEWRSLYRFDLQEQQLPDYEVSNWYVSTHPNSLFTTALIVARPDTDCRYSLRNTQLTTHYLDGRTERLELGTVTELCRVLEEVFQLRLPAIAALEPALQRLGIQ